MTKYHIVTILVVLAVVGAFFAAHVFYIMPQVEKYDENARYFQSVQSRVEELRDTFDGYQPDQVVARWEEAVDPWAEEAAERRPFFSLGGALQIDAVPDDPLDRKTFYERKYNDELFALQVYAAGDMRSRLFRPEGFSEEQMEEASREGRYVPAPAFTFGAPNPRRVFEMDVDKGEVAGWLRDISFGADLTRRLIDADPRAIQNVVIWPERRDGLIEYRTAGVRMVMNLDDLSSFLNELADERRYFNVDALRIRANTLLWPDDPPLVVSLLLTQARLTQPQGGQRQGFRWADDDDDEDDDDDGFNGFGGGYGGGPPKKDFWDRFFSSLPF
jgi:hypothetical protein